MALGIVARTKCVKKVAPGKTKHSDGRGGSNHLARHTTESWPMGRVVESYPGDDGRVWIVKVQVRQGTLIKPIANLCPLRRRDVGLKKELEKRERNMNLFKMKMISKLFVNSYKRETLVYKLNANAFIKRQRTSNLIHVFKFPIDFH